MRTDLNYRPYAAANRYDRASQGAGTILFGKGGLGYIARRGVDFGTSIALQSIEGVARLAAQQPLMLLALLSDIVPEVGMALWNGVMLGCTESAVRLRAMTIDPDGHGEEAPDGTAAIDALFLGNPPEVGDLHDCIAQNFQCLQTSGMAACEAVPGRRRTGINAIYPVNSLTLRFKREADGRLQLYQRQTSDPTGLGAYTMGMGGLYEPMPMDRFFWSKLDGLPDEPYGRAPMSPALTEVLRVLSFWQDFQTAFHRIGTPAWDFAFDFEAAKEFYRVVENLTDPVEINKLVQEDFQSFIDAYNAKKPDDAFFHGTTMTVNAVGAGDKWPDIPALWEIFRERLIMALKQLPALMGINTGATETWTAVQWSIYSTGLQTMVQKATAPLVQACNLHLRLLGMPYVCEAAYTPIRSAQRLLDAQAEAMEIANEANKVKNRWQTNITAAQTITGTAPPDDQQWADDVKPDSEPTNSTATDPILTDPALNPSDKK